MIPDIDFTLPIIALLFALAALVALIIIRSLARRQNQSMFMRLDFDAFKTRENNDRGVLDRSNR